MEVGAAKYHACRLSALPVAMSARTYTRGHGPEQAAVNRLTGLECINYTYCVSLAFVAVRTFSCTVGAWASEGTLVQVGRGQGRQGLHSSVKSRMLPALEFGARSSPAGRLAVFSGRRALRSPRAQRPEALSSCGSHVPRPPMPVGSGAAGRWYSASLSISVPPGPAADSGCVTAERPAGHSCHTAWMQQRRAHDSNQVNRDPDRYLVAPRPHLLDSWTDFNEHARLAADHPLAEPVGRPDHRKVRLTRWWPVVAPVVILAIGLSLLSPPADISGHSRSFASRPITPPFPSITPGNYLPRSRRALRFRCPSRSATRRGALSAIATCLVRPTVVAISVYWRLLKTYSGPAQAG